MGVNWAQHGLTSTKPVTQVIFKYKLTIVSDVTSRCAIVDDTKSRKHVKGRIVLCPIMTANDNYINE